MTIVEVICGALIFKVIIFAAEFCHVINKPTFETWFIKIYSFFVNSNGFPEKKFILTVKDIDIIEANPPSIFLHRPPVYAVKWKRNVKWKHAL